ncbi:putative DNA-binding domain-containing protein [Ponticoccus sp. SC2-23]|uniref:HvfC/BufC N-terminal domain-containing protein n=1 Tax=Alexandriicola marinus TaxID=2081710 RepID=UPI00193C2805|nr:DNA-binding domain-containing protein [Alexandriicola marinus]MBM1219618.1 putative DNA-binding domain-containing protein [Ponticoccus sp. SC6-9]MBM1223310.1 putative DNA-binding domain-containing protein [Ponticoccus sp. SC6-15]MBM1229431.1 putative DNA-binding domain-containing protein [Ponticoccus sp. SC6-38]MBM1232276.1 putative DNA-binding domain-containing protein [Ponticoccus sp. SC6-45]MBM1237774.1 putative DNA-binding domain-containing protein [Ponticoccus sp. SC6-49]MBM1241287.1 
MMPGQTEFTAALMDASRPAPQGLRDGRGRQAGKRFDVYRNNVAVSLTEALEAGFPVIRKLVGDEFFRAMAGVFLRAHPPASPLMMHYGAEMPAFLEDFGPAGGLPYLPDVARLELALRRSYHAADAAPIDPASLAAVPPVAMAGLRLHFAPAVILVTSSFPILDIWRVNSGAGGGAPRPKEQTALVLRPEFDPRPVDPGPGAAPVLAALIEGATLAASLDRAGPEFDLPALLGLLLSNGVITGFDLED